MLFPWPSLIRIRPYQVSCPAERLSILAQVLDIKCLHLSNYPRGYDILILAWSPSLPGSFISYHYYHLNLLDIYRYSAVVLRILKVFLKHKKVTTLILFMYVTGCVLTTYSNLETRNRIYLSRCVGQDRNCHRKSCLLNCYLSTYFLM